MPPRPARRKRVTNVAHAATDDRPRSQRDELLVAREINSARRRSWILAINNAFGWCFLMPLCLLSVIAFCIHFAPALLNGLLHGSKGLKYFVVGAVLWSLCHYLSGRRFMVAYVFAHEWTHALVARVFWAKIYKIHVTSTGGYVETNKSNVFISLAPYVVPFYTILFMALMSLLEATTSLASITQLHLGRVTLPYNHTVLYFLGIGLTWSFHLAYTIQTLRTEQTDLTRNGETFSLFIILTLNVYLLAWLILLSAPEMGWIGAWHTLQHTFVTAAEWAKTAYLLVKSLLIGIVEELRSSHKDWRPA